jgi:hypothetical protein
VSIATCLRRYTFANRIIVATVLLVSRVLRFLTPTQMALYQIIGNEAGLPTMDCRNGTTTSVALPLPIVLGVFWWFYCHLRGASDIGGGSPNGGPSAAFPPLAVLY